MSGPGRTSPKRRELSPRTPSLGIGLGSPGMPSALPILAGPLLRPLWYRSRGRRVVPRPRACWSLPPDIACSRPAPPGRARTPPPPSRLAGPADRTAHAHPLRVSPSTAGRGRWQAAPAPAPNTIHGRRRRSTPLPCAPENRTANARAREGRRTWKSPEIPGNPSRVRKKSRRPRYKCKRGLVDLRAASTRTSGRCSKPPPTNTAPSSRRARRHPRPQSPRHATPRPCGGSRVSRSAAWR